MDVASSTSIPRDLLLPVVALLTLAGCASVVGDVRPFAPVAPMAGMDIPMASSPAIPGAHQQTGMASQARHSSGSIYANSGGGNTTGLRLFQDNKAREVGDLLTIVLVERTSSTSRAKTAVSKNSGLSLGAPVIAGVPVTHNGQSILQAEIEAGRDFNGSGDSTQSNRLDGEVTVSVVKALGNGNLLVSGQKQVRLNQGDELVQVQGIVRTADIGPDNRITSDRVGNAQIVYGGRGTLARSNAMGWLGRFFNSAAFPY
ncbi:MAG TPA: flagellar basal body L-ring protein FlgH [Lysobacter sp.]|nr:flagellar basal body L-ring protein FlgH [Lysobacter sp.]